MHVYFPVTPRHAGAAGGASTLESPADAGQILVVRDPEDESEWQYLGNPEIAATTSLAEVVARFIQDCGEADGMIGQEHVTTATALRDALLRAATQIDDALPRPGAE